LSVLLKCRPDGVHSWPPHLSAKDDRLFKVSLTLISN
jgi:hypothetical protein